MKPSKETRRVEGRDQPKENLHGEAEVRTQSWRTLPPNLVRVNAAAHRADQTRFTALMHHVDREALVLIFVLRTES
jgi:RNA-directed DNA polymerase